MEDRVAGARARDAVLSVVLLLCAILLLCYSSTYDHPWGGTASKVIANLVLAASALGMAVSGVRCPRPWARIVSAVVLAAATITVFTPHMALTPLAAAYDLIMG